MYIYIYIYVNYKLYTLPKQLAAVNMKVGVSIAPEQGISEYKFTCQGHCPGVLSSPPSIRLVLVLLVCFFGLFDFPHFKSIMQVQ